MGEHMGGRWGVGGDGGVSVGGDWGVRGDGGVSVGGDWGVEGIVESMGGGRGNGDEDINGGG